MLTNKEYHGQLDRNRHNGFIGIDILLRQQTIALLASHIRPNTV